MERLINNHLIDIIKTVDHNPSLFDHYNIEIERPNDNKKDNKTTMSLQ